MKALFVYFLSLIHVLSVSVELNEKSFSSFLLDNEFAFILFYAPWCAHCKKLKPEFDKAGDYFDKSKNVALGKLDCTESPKICANFKVSAYPTLKFFINGEPFEYNGGRSTAEIIEWIDRFVS
jgi:protein disulfide-isomerase-like protein